MPAEGWRPLSWRQGNGLAAGAWREAVPAALERPLRRWVMHAVGWVPVISREVTEPLLLRLNLVVPDDYAREDNDWPPDGENNAQARFLAFGTPVDVLIDVVDAVLDLIPVSSDSPDFAAYPPAGQARWTGWVLGSPPRPPGSQSAEELVKLRADLACLLSDALSAMRIRADGRGLERRPGTGTEEAFRETVTNAEAAADTGSAAAHLRSAWECAYALHPDPGKAYSEAIKAVEAAAHAVVLPHDAKATLGSMRGHLRANRSRFALAIRGPDDCGDVGPLLECLSLLWEGQVSRHGSRNPTRQETLEEAVMAVHLAVVLVQWFTSGAVRRV
jgi:hypothetical protein